MFFTQKIVTLTKSFGSFKLNLSIKDGIFPISTHKVRVEMAWPGFILHKAFSAFERSLPSAVSSSPFDIRAVTTENSNIFYSGSLFIPQWYYWYLTFENSIFV